MGPRINKIFGMSRVTSKGSAPELVKRETDTRVTCTVDALKHSETLCAITMCYMLRMERTILGNSPTANIRGKGDEIGKSSRIDDKVFQDQRQQDDYDLQDERQDQPKEEELVDLLSGCKPLGYKWIFKKKRKADSTVDKYKARLVIKGFRQREGLDYFDTYSLVTRITSIRMILAIAALRNLEVHQIDVKKAFLNGDLEEEIYMNQPEGFMAPGLGAMIVGLLWSII
ncbi:retrotransposon protein, putative, ty1-copia subclass [Tanacetum coccineum]